MAFYGRTFQYGDFQSEEFNLYISSPDGGDVEISGSGNVELITQDITRKASPYLLYVRHHPVLEFDIFINAPGELSSEDARLASRHLFGKSNYDKLWIMQPDMRDFYFNCIFTNYRTQKVGNRIVGFRATVTCDSPYAWELAQSKIYPSKTTYYDDLAQLVSEQISYMNLSDYTGANNPYLIITVERGTDDTNRDVSIVNASLSNRTTTLENIPASYTWTSTSHLGINTCISDADVSMVDILENFNKVFFKLAPGRNTIELTGNIKRFTITHRNAVKIGG